MKFKSDIEAQAAIRDASNSPGTANQILSSTVSGTAWINPGAIGGGYLPLSAGSGFPLTGDLYGTNAFFTGTVQVKNSSSPTLQIYNTDTFVNVGQALGKLDFYSTDGAKVSSYIEAEYTSAQGSSELIFGISAGASAASEIMRLASTGNVGIGTAAPAYKLHVVGGDAQIANGSTGTLYMNNANNYLYGDVNGIGIVAAGNNFRVKTNNSERLRIIQNGNVGIGTTAPASKLEVAEETANTSAYITVDSLSWNAGLTLKNGNGTWEIFNDYTGLGTTDALAFYNGGYHMVIDNTGNIGIGTTSPSYKLDVEGDVGINDYIQHNGDNSRIGFPSNDVIALVTSNAERMRIDSAGNVGIGTATPTSNLEVVGNGGTVLDVQGSQGQLFSVTDSLSGSIFAVSDISGVPIMDVNSSGLTTFAGLVEGIAPVNASNFVTKAYVDGSGGGTGGPFLPLAGGTLTGTVIQNGGNIDFSDGRSANFGNADDLQIYHDGSHSYIKEAGAGRLYINSGNGVWFGNEDASEINVKINTNAAVELRYDNSIKLETTSTGVAVTGAVAASLDITAGSYTRAAQTTVSILSDAQQNSILKFREDDDLHGFTLGYYGSPNDFVITRHDGSSTGVAVMSIPRASSNVTFTGTVTSPTFLGDLNGTINTVTTAVTKANATNDTTVATTAFVQNLIGTIPAGLVFQGTWNAATNTPTLTSGSGTTGNFYIVSTSGSTNLDGVTDWVTGDWAVFIEQGATDAWEKIDNSSVLDGTGTGQTVALWDGSGTSNTLTDAPITVSGSDTTFAGTSTFGGDLYLTTNTDILKVGTNPFRLFTNGTLALSVSASQNATFAGNITFGDSHFIGDDASDNLLIQSSAGENIIIDSLDETLFRINGSTKMQIKSSGNVGIGTTNPSEKLSVYDSSASVGYVASFGNTSNLELLIGTTTGSYLNIQGSTISSGAPYNISLQNDGGNVGIGVTDPQAKLEVKGPSASPADGNEVISVTNTTGGSKLLLGVAENQYGWIQSAEGGTYRNLLLNPLGGNVGIGTTSPTAAKLVVDSDTAPQILVKNSSGANSQILFEDNSGGSQSASITFDQAGDNALSIITEYDSPSDLNKIQLVPGGEVAMTLSGGDDSTGTNGIITFNGYVGTRQTGTPTYILGTDAAGNIVKVLGSNIPGSGGSNNWTVSGNDIYNNNSGNVGIGTTAPIGLLNVSKNSTTDGLSQAITVSSSTVSTKRMNLGYVPGSDYAFIDVLNYGISNSNQALSLQPNGGKVGIGTNSPGVKLEVNGDIGIGRVAGGYTFRETVGGGERASIKSNAANELIFNYGGATEAMRIKDNGNVGIGTTAPSAKLVVSNAGATGYEIDPTSSSGTIVSLFSYDRTANLWRATRYSGLDHRFEINGTTEAVRITSGGNVGIGTTSPNGKLQVDGDIYVNGADKKIMSYSGAVDYGTLSNNSVRFNANGSEKMRITSAGNVGIGTTNPGYKLEVIGTAKISDLPSATFGDIVTVNSAGQLTKASSSSGNYFADMSFGESYISNYKSRVLDYGGAYFPTAAASNVAKHKASNVFNLLTMMLLPGGVFTGKITAAKPKSGVDFAWIRTTVANYTDEEGVIQEAAIATPRIDYANNSNGEILIEPTRTNIVPNSGPGDYGNGPGSSTTVPGPNGVYNSAIVPVPDASADRYQYTIPSGTYSDGDVFTYSWYRRRLSTPVQNVFVGDLSIQGLVNCSLTGATTQIESNISGFDRFACEITLTLANTNALVRGYFGAVIGTGNSSVAYFGQQLELGDFATTLINTTGSAVTRDNDYMSVNTLSSTIFQGIVGQGGFYMDFDYKREGDGDGLRFYDENNITPRVYIYQGNTGISDSWSAGAFTLNQTSGNKIGYMFTSTTSAIYCANGSNVVTSSPSAAQALDTPLDVIYIDGNQNLVRIRELSMFTQMTSEQLVTLTTI